MLILLAAASAAPCEPIAPCVLEAKGDTPLAHLSVQHRALDDAGRLEVLSELRASAFAKSTRVRQNVSSFLVMNRELRPEVAIRLRERKAPVALLEEALTKLEDPGAITKSDLKLETCVLTDASTDEQLVARCTLRACQSPCIARTLEVDLIGGRAPWALGEVRDRGDEDGNCEHCE